MFNEKAQADPLFLDDIIALHAMDMFPRYSLPLPVQPENQKRFGAFFVMVGWESLGCPKAFRWTRGENGGMRFGRICAHSFELNCNVRKREHIHGNWNVEMALRAEFLTVFWAMVVSRAGRFFW